MWKDSIRMLGNTLGISSIGPYWNLQSVNYFQESIHFCNFFHQEYSGKQKTLKKKLIRLVKVLILPNIMLW